VVGGFALLQVAAVSHTWFSYWAYIGAHIFKGFPFQEDWGYLFKVETVGRFFKFSAPLFFLKLS
jgi:hypothetical protein